MSLFALLLVCYFTVNFVCALVLHLHGLRHAHRPPRVPDVLMHFVLLTAFAIPVLLVICGAALFAGEERGSGRGYQPVPLAPGSR